MRELVFTCALVLLGSGCVEVVSHIDEFDAGPPPKPADAAMEAEVSLGQCVSGMRWTGGNMPPFPVHYPGRACMQSGCHNGTAKFPFTIAGTVYPVIPMKGDHDDDDCNGIDGSATGPGAAVAIFDDQGMTEIIPRLQVNAAGNFYTNKALPGSFKVKVLSQNRTAEQMSVVMDGNCNSCHSKDGVAGAKGRIIPAPP